MILRLTTLETRFCFYISFVFYYGYHNYVQKTLMDKNITYKLLSYIIINNSKLLLLSPQSFVTERADAFSLHRFTIVCAKISFRVQKYSLINFYSFFHKSEYCHDYKGHFYFYIAFHFFFFFFFFFFL